MQPLRYLTLPEVAEHYRTSPATVRFWRHKGIGPRGVVVGRRVLFSVDEIYRYDRELADQLADQTAEPQPTA